MVQEAIDASVDVDTEMALPGTYFECVSFNGKRTHVICSDPDDPATVAATVIDGAREGLVVSFTQGEDPQ